jgi:hypothetical protein
MSLWLVSVPNEGNRSSETTFNELKAETASSKHDYAGKVVVNTPLLSSTNHSIYLLLLWDG